MNAHDEHRANILLYLDNELRGQDIENFLAHLDNCADCRKLLEEERALSNLLHRTRPLYTAPESLRARIAVAAGQPPASGDKPKRKHEHLFRFGWRTVRRSGFRWMSLAAMIVVVVLGLTSVPRVVRHAEAATFIDTAVTTHRAYQENQLPLEIRSSSPGAVTAWFDGKVPFQFRLPSSQSPPSGHPAYALTGARLVKFKKENAALVSYQMEAETISLLVASDKSAVAAGGDEIRSGNLTFYYNTRAELNVITWSTHGITYALVSSIHGSSQHSCLVCHQNMANQNTFQ
jgi:mycothiol system anti-sigma-R factor